MNPAIGLDVAKGESIAQAFLDKGMPHGKQFTVVHTRGGLEQFHQALREVEAHSSLQPTIEEDKPYKVAVIACVNKLIHWIYVLLKRKELFVDLE